MWYNQCFEFHNIFQHFLRILSSSFYLIYNMRSETEMFRKMEPVKQQQKNFTNYLLSQSYLVPHLTSVGHQDDRCLGLISSVLWLLMFCFRLDLRCLPKPVDPDLLRFGNYSGNLQCHMLSGNNYPENTTTEWFKILMKATLNNLWIKIGKS